MKKVLFATTALVATAGMAAADVSFGGYGRFGLYYQENDTDADTSRIEQRFRLTITGTTETDNGIKFEGRIRLQTDEDSDGAVGAAKTSAAGFAATFGGFRLDVGDVSNVLDSGDVVDYFGYGVGLTSFLEQANTFSNTAVGFGVQAQNPNSKAQTIKFNYVYGDFTFAASYTDDATTNSIAIGDGIMTDSLGNIYPEGVLYWPESENLHSWQIGAGYTFGNYSVGAVYGSTESNGVPGEGSNDEWIINFAGDVGALGFSVIVGDSDFQDGTAYGFSVKYDVGAATEVRFVYTESGDDDASLAPDEKSDSYGIGFRHSLGGGVSLQGGYGRDRGTDKADLGVIFNF